MDSGDGERWTKRFCRERSSSDVRSAFRSREIFELNSIELCFDLLQTNNEQKKCHMAFEKVNGPSIGFRFFPKTKSTYRGFVWLVVCSRPFELKMPKRFVLFSQVDKRQSLVIILGSRSRSTKEDSRESAHPIDRTSVLLLCRWIARVLRSNDHQGESDENEQTDETRPENVSILFDERSNFFDSRLRRFEQRIRRVWTRSVGGKHFVVCDDGRRHVDVQLTRMKTL